MSQTCSYCNEPCKKNKNKNPKNSFCNRICYYNFKKLTILKFNCFNCDKVTFKSRNDSIKPHNIYCSRKCMISKRNHNKKSSCEICNHEIYFNGTRKNKKCQKCYQKSYKEKHPEKSTSNQLKSERIRIKKGLPFDHKFRQENGKGTLRKHDGYKLIPRKNHPNSFKNGHIMEHVWVMSEYLKRPLLKGEIVHHKNGVRHDNRIENLELWNKAHPSGQRIIDRIDYYVKFLSDLGIEINLQTVSKIRTYYETRIHT